MVLTPQANLVTGMKWLLGTYTIKFNRRHATIGHRFAGRYRAVLVDVESPQSLPAVCHFTHLAIVGRWAKGRPLRDYPWSSYSHYLQPPDHRPTWLNPQPLFSKLHLTDDAPGRAQLEEITEQARITPPGPLWKQIRRGWCVGTAEFRQQMLKRVSQAGPNSAAPRREFSREQAEAIVAAELQALGWSEAVISQRPKGDPEKIRIARRLRQETTVSLRWIAQRLNAGSWTHLANCLYRKETSPAAAQDEKPKRQSRARKVKAPATPPPAPTGPASAIEELPVYCL
jgi:hypothetical protein